MPSRHVRQGSLDGERDDERAMLHRDAGRPAGKELVAQSVDARAAHVGVVQLVFQSRFAYAGRDIASSPNVCVPPSFHAKANGFAMPLPTPLPLYRPDVASQHAEHAQPYLYARPTTAHIYNKV